MNNRTMMRIIAPIRRCNDWCRHAEARHPIRYLLVFLPSLFLLLTAFNFALSPSAAAGGVTLAAVAIFGALLAFTLVLQAFWWRAGGRKRVAYERWVARDRRQLAATGWFPDPTARHRVRYMDREKWTRWVADGDDAIIDRGAVGADYLGPDASTTRARRALPLLIGFVAGGVLGTVTIVPALMFPHTHAIGIISADNTHPVGVRWWALGTIIVLAIGARALWMVRSHLDVTAEADEPVVMPRRAFERTVAFANSFVPTFCIAAVAAWATWIQNGLMLPFPIFSFVALAGFVGIALMGTIFATKVIRIERHDHATLRSRGLLPALRGAFVEANPI